VVEFSSVEYVTDAILSRVMWIPQTTRRQSFFVMVLCYSRMIYVEFTVSQTMEHFLACHQHAFECFGGTPSSVMVDNLKSAVLKRTLGQAPVFNPGIHLTWDSWQMTVLT
jgi:transposase